MPRLSPTMMEFSDFEGLNLIVLPLEKRYLPRQVVQICLQCLRLIRCCSLQIGKSISQM